MAVAQVSKLVETYAAYALNVLLAGGTSTRATRFARASALGSLALGSAGQVAYHLMSAAGMVSAPWQITAVVACLPVAVLGMGAALYHLVHEHQAETPANADQSDRDAADPGIEAGPADEAEARTERAVIVNALSERHPDWTPEIVTEMAGALAEDGHLPTPAPRADVTDADSPTAAGDALPELIDVVNKLNARHPDWNLPVPEMPGAEVRKATPVRKPRRGDAGAKVRDLRAKHPDWTVEKIAAKAGVTDRTVRRHLNASTSATSEATPVETDQAPDLAA